MQPNGGDINYLGNFTDLEIDATGFGPGCSSETTPRFERPRSQGEKRFDLLLHVKPIGHTELAVR